MIDRIEEYRRDWVSGPAPKKRARKPFKASRPVKIGGILLLALVAAVTSGQAALQRWQKRLEKTTNDEVCKMKTELELSAQLRLLRQYYLSNGSLPQDPIRYLEPYLKDNKPYPKGCDFWGHPYRVDQYWDYFGVRSAGPNGKWEDRDDLLASVRFKDISADR
ncbi:hypothetical protein IV102_26410 [bacterium]|nr:hypothetical protein [bacterium]